MTMSTNTACEQHAHTQRRLHALATSFLLLVLVATLATNTTALADDTAVDESNSTATIAADADAIVAQLRREQIAQFLQHRKALTPLCMYTFDQPKRLVQNSTSTLATSDHNASASNSSSDAHNHSIAIDSRPTLLFANLVPDDACPFGDLQADTTLVQSLNTTAHSFQLGVRIDGTATTDRKRMQIASTDVVDARKMYEWGVASFEHDNGDHTGGMTFEIALRLHAQASLNGSSGAKSGNTVNATSNSTDVFADMTLFSIANVYDGCVDPGFRVDVAKDGTLVLVYYLPMKEPDRDPQCYEQELRSSNDESLFETLKTKCVLPIPQSGGADGSVNPVVYIAVTVNPSKTEAMWYTEFVVSYAHPVTLERVHCFVPINKNPPMHMQLMNERIHGSYRIFIGNSPHNVSAAMPRRTKAPTRMFRPLSIEDMTRNGTERLRAVLLKKLMSIKGPRMPEAMRLLGDKSVSFKLFGIQLPPVNEDSPLAYVRGKLRDYLVKNGNKMVNHLINMLRKVQTVEHVEEHHHGSHLVKYLNDWLKKRANETARKGDYPNAAHVSSFDVFHFAIYKTPLVWKDALDGTWSRLGPLRALPALEHDVKIREDEVATLDTALLQSVFDDVQLEIRSLPERGTLLMYPNRTVVTSTNMMRFRELSPRLQRQLYFEPKAHESNDNLPLKHAFAFTQRIKPYATVELGMYRSTTGRQLNASAVTRITIFVSPVNDAPRPLQMLQHVTVARTGVPVAFELLSDDADGSPSPSLGASTNSTLNDATNGSESATAVAKPKMVSSIVDAVKKKVNASLKSFGKPAPPPPKRFVKVTRLPRFGRLYDQHLGAMNESLQLPLGRDHSRLEHYRISIDDIVNRTFSTNLVYVPDDAHSDMPRKLAAAADESNVVVDELWYRLNDGEPGLYSDVAVVQFVRAPSHRNINVVETNNTHDDSSFLDVVQLREDSSTAVTLTDMEPLLGLLDIRTQFHITRFPKHGSLYQYRDITTPSRSARSTSSALAAAAAAGTIDAGRELYRTGKKISTTDATVRGVFGRIVYVPDRDYYNTLANDGASPPRFPIDTFAFEPENLSTHLERLASRASANQTLSASLLAAARQPRVIGLQVLGEPDELVLLPPMRFAANSSSGAVPVPVRFDDPDALYDGQYHVTVKAVGGFSRIILGDVNVSNDDVMRQCNLSRPCRLERSFVGANRTLQSDAGSATTLPASTNRSDDKAANAANANDTKLTFYIQNVILTPYFVSVVGTKRALQRALSAMTFANWNINWKSSARKQLAVKLTRVNDRFEAIGKPATATYIVDSPPMFAGGGLDDMVLAIATLAATKIEELIWTMVVSVLVCLLLTNPTCFSKGIGCCSSRKRERRRRAFEDERTRFEQQVAQNDYEYSLLLLDVADMLVAPDLVLATSLVFATSSSKGGSDSRSISNNNDGSSRDLRQLHLCLRSLMPVLETERQGSHFVFRLIVLEFERATHESPSSRDTFERDFLGGTSCAGRALASFCSAIGRDWLTHCVSALAGVEQHDVRLLDRERQASRGNVDATEQLQRIDSTLELLHVAIAQLPVEIVILCRACAKLFTGDAGVEMRREHRAHSQQSDRDCRIVQLRAVHLVFFCHFLGPALRFGCSSEVTATADSHNGSHRSQRDLRRKLAGIAVDLAMLAQRWDGPYRVSASDDDVYALVNEHDEPLKVHEQTQLKQYERLLDVIATSPTLASSFDPTLPSTKTNVSSLASHIGDAVPTTELDCETMGLCLMNVHSLLDAFLPQVEQQATALTNWHRESSDARHWSEHGSDDDAAAATAVLLSRLRTLLRALSFPSVSVDGLVDAIARDDSAQWLCRTGGFSMREWIAFADAATHSWRRRRDGRNNDDARRNDVVDDMRRHATHSRSFGRSQSLLAVHMDDSVLELDDIAMLEAADRF